MNIIVKTFMVDATDMQVKYSVIQVWWRNPKVIVLKRQAELAVEALARRVNTRRSLEEDIRKLFMEHIFPEQLEISIA